MSLGHVWASEWREEKWLRPSSSGFFLLSLKTKPLATNCNLFGASLSILICFWPLILCFVSGMDQIHRERKEEVRIAAMNPANATATEAEGGGNGDEYEVWKMYEVKLTTGIEFKGIVLAYDSDQQFVIFQEGTVPETGKSMAEIGDFIRAWRTESMAETAIELGNELNIWRDCKMQWHKKLQWNIVFHCHFLQIGLLNVDGYYNNLLALFDTGVEKSFIKPGTRNIIVVSAPSAKELLEKMEVPATTTS